MFGKVARFNMQKECGLNLDFVAGIELGIQCAVFAVREGNGGRAQLFPKCIQTTSDEMVDVYGSSNATVHRVGEYLGFCQGLSIHKLFFLYYEANLRVELCKRLQNMVLQHAESWNKAVVSKYSKALSAPR